MDAMRQPEPPPPVMHANVDAAGSRIRRRLRAAALWWARRCCSYSPAPAAATEEEQVRADWSGLPEDLMLIAMASMEVLDLISCGLVCSSWRTAYKTFRHLRLPTLPNQPPCLLYAPRPVISDEEDGPPTMMLYSPSTDVSLCLQRPSRLRGVTGSAYGWLFAMDEAANPYLVNPLTGAEAALPPITTLERVRGSFTDEDGEAVFDVQYGRRDYSRRLTGTVRIAIDDAYERVAISAPPAAGGAAAADCVVVVKHMLSGEVSFARVGDDRWTSISHQLRTSFIDINTNCMHGMETLIAAGGGNLFYLMAGDGFVYVVDLAGPAPVVRSRTKVLSSLKSFRDSHYLVVAPSGGLLLVTRGMCRDEDDVDDGHWSKVTTIEMFVRRIDLESGETERLDGIGKEHALFLGRGSPVWVPAAKDHPLLRPNCVYLTDDRHQSATIVVLPPIIREDLVVYDFESCSSKKLAHAWPRLCPWLYEPTPIWITPSLY